MSRAKKAFSIEVKITDRCNQECSHCVNRDGPEKGRTLDWRLFNRRLEEWAANRSESAYDIKEIRMTGGEPLIEFDSVLGIAECCRHLGIRSGINTNGMLLDQDRIRRFKEYGIEIIKVSCDAVNPESHHIMRGPIGSLDPQWDTVKTLIEQNFKVILRFTLMRPNLDQVQPCHVMAEGLGAHKFQIKPLIRAGGAESHSGLLSRAEVNAALRELSEARAESGLATELLCWPQIDNDGFQYRICGSIDKIYVATDGNVTVCNFIPKKKQVFLGNISMTPLEAMLQNRENECLHKSANGNRFVRGCPNALFFEIP